jgi:UDP-3-O-[3-hydroxymyristoyl] glucosamine N-acyltransferase
VQVGHASKVGKNSLLCGQVGLAGSTRVGKNCILAGQVGAAGHLTIGDGAVGDITERRSQRRSSRRALFGISSHRK